MHSYKYLFLLLAGTLTLSACSLQNRLNKSMVKQADPALDQAFLGFSIYNETSGKFLYEQQADHVFTPASNTKLLTCFAAMQHLPDSLPGFFIYESPDTLYVKPNGDPTFLHPDFKQHPFFEYLKRSEKPIALVLDKTPNFLRMGSGWSWSSYQATYMPERSQMPIYGNLVRFKTHGNKLQAIPGYFNAYLEDKRGGRGDETQITRKENQNIFIARSSQRGGTTRPFTQRLEPELTAILLQDTLAAFDKTLAIKTSSSVQDAQWSPFYTQPTDSVLKIMMHRSDNFFAEQILLMCGQALTGSLSDRAAINAIKEQDLADVQPLPSWVDGSGLSRYNQMAPHFLVNLLAKMKRTQDWSRLQEVLPHGNEGTLRGLYEGYEDNIWGKTGTLSGDVALSGYLISEKGNKYIFSFLVNHHQTSAGKVRLAIEEILTDIIREH